MCFEEAERTGIEDMAHFLAFLGSIAGLLALKEEGGTHHAEDMLSLENARDGSGVYATGQLSDSEAAMTNADHPKEEPMLQGLTDLGTGLPSLDVADYDRVIMGQTFASTLKLDKGDDNVLLINNVFTDIDGNALELRNVSNVTIYDCDFSGISGSAIRLRSSGSTDRVSIISNRFDDIGRNAVKASKRYDKGVDHTNLRIFDNDIGDTGLRSDRRAHAIYVQSSGTRIWGNSIVGTTDANAISIRGDGIVRDNFISVTSSDPWGSGIKYYADHKSGDSKTLVIADNRIAGENLYSGVEIKASPDSIPTGIPEEDWIVNDFHLARNSFGKVKRQYVIDNRIRDAAWSQIEVLD